MKEELINIIKILGIGCTEIIIDIETDFITINSVEYFEPDEIILHYFKDDELDIEINFDDLEYEYQRLVYNLLSIHLYN